MDYINLTLALLDGIITLITGSELMIIIGLLVVLSILSFIYELFSPAKFK